MQVRGHSCFNIFCAPSKQKVFGPFIFAEGTVAGEVYLDILEQLPMLILITHFSTSISTLRDWFRHIGMRQCGWHVGFPPVLVLSMSQSS